MATGPTLKMKAINLSDIDVPDVRVRARYDEELTENLHQSITDMGQLEPILVYYDGGRYTLVDGAHRLEEARARGDRTIPAIIREGSQRDALLANLATSHVKGKTHPGDVLQVIMHLVKSEGLDSDAIALATGMKRDQVERYWKIGESSPWIQARVEDGSIPLGAAYHIARLPNHVQQEELASIVAQYHMPVADVKAKVDEVLEVINNPQPPLVHPEPQPAPPPTCESCHQVADGRNLRPALLCPECYGEVYRLARRSTAPQAASS